MSRLSSEEIKQFLDRDDTERLATLGPDAAAFLASATTATLGIIRYLRTRKQPVLPYHPVDAEIVESDNPDFEFVYEDEETE